jgi:hypothetical protein
VQAAHDATDARRIGDGLTRAVRLGDFKVFDGAGFIPDILTASESHAQMAAGKGGLWGFTRVGHGALFHDLANLHHARLALKQWLVRMRLTRQGPSAVQEAWGAGSKVGRQYPRDGGADQVRGAEGRLRCGNVQGGHGKIL